ncbi:MAG: hypothetical protein Q9M43_00775 [Sulfurimonas sp.]|nr:hypothetical protein [Sulfurimonas sp.]
MISELIHDVDYDDVRPIADYFHKETGIIFDTQMIILKSKVIAFC